SGGSTPGAQLALQNYLASQVTSTYLGSGVFTATNQYNVDIYQFSVDLTTSFDASARTEYWLSIMARSATFDPIFAWRAGTGGNGTSYQQVLGANESVTNSGSVAHDRHLLIEGTFAVPEPGGLSLVLVALGACSLGAAARRATRPRVG